MAEQKIDELKISEEEANAVRISNSADRPNAFNSYRESKKTAADVKKMFDAPFELLREKHDKTVDELRKYNAAETEREASETEREEAETKRANAEQERKTAEITRDEKIDEFYEAYKSGKLKGDKGDKGDPGSVNVVDGPGDSETDAMSQKASSNAFCNALKGFASGVSPLVITDLSPNPHTIKVKASGGSKVIRYGKNLFENDISKIELIEEVGSHSYGYELSLPAGKYTIHTEVNLSDLDNDDKYLTARIKRADGTLGSQLYFSTASKLSNETFEILQGDVLLIYVEYGTSKTLASSQKTFSRHNIQLEMGATATAYEPCVTPMECAVVDGVAEVMSAYPTTIIISDTEGVTLEATYNKDLNKAFGENNLESVMTTEGAVWEE
jgi:hypothetical protein